MCLEQQHKQKSWGSAGMKAAHTGHPQFRPKSWGQNNGTLGDNKNNSEKGRTWGSQERPVMEVQTSPSVEMDPEQLMGIDGSLGEVGTKKPILFYFYFTLFLCLLSYPRKYQCSFGWWLQQCGSRPALSNLVGTNHKWLLTTWSVASLKWEIL